MTKKMLVLALPLMVALTAGLFLPTVARAAGATQINIPIPAFDLINDCNGEVIAFDAGSLHVVARVDIKNGIGHLIYHENVNFSGVGSSGAKYNLNAAQNEELNLKLVANTGETTTVINEHLVGQGPSNNLLLHILLHITVNANGDVTVDFFKVSEECSNG